MDIRFYNTFNLAQPLLDHLLIELNDREVKATAYVSKYKYRSTNKGTDQIHYFESAWLTRFSSFHKRFNQFVYCIAAAIKVLYTKPRLNIFFTQPPLFVIFGAWFSRVRGVPYAVHAMDLYPDLVGALGYLNTNKWLYKWLDRQMTNAYENSKFVAVPGRCMKVYISEKGIDPSKIKVVYNLPSIRDSGASSDYLEDMDLADKFTILYAGNMGVAHEFSSMLALAKEFSQTHPDICFLVVGKGYRRPEVERYIADNKPENIRLFGYLENEEFEAILKGTKLHYISLRDNFNGLMVPSKLYSSLAMSQPILFEGSPLSEISLSMAEYPFGSHVAHRDVSAFKSAILKYYKDPNALVEAGNMAKKYFEVECDLDRIVDDYTGFLVQKVQTK